MRGLERSCAFELVPRPGSGRLVSHQRRTRAGDCDTRGLIRLDGIARYMEDVANDDIVDVGLPRGHSWVVRRTHIRVEKAATIGEMVTCSTWCSGLGPAWAERRTSIEGERGAEIEAASTWVFIELGSGRPARLVPQFVDLYAEAAGGRRVKGRLMHPSPPADSTRRRWQLRHRDFDVLGHMNNAAYWEVVVDELARRPDIGPRVWAEVEYRAPIEVGDEVEIQVCESGSSLEVWLSDTQRVYASTVVAALEGCT
ncbi:MAG: hypothetical protein JJLCMIEE_00512 [Acidimicrobiales bacterium]|nr:MAG: hypothetical protein EDR02_04145 [Actinomycetota bacterium]MBV6507464.1 hypothetical protein [Acidimicrobiales bacterium]RIK07844.1 MAG: hypothetical protein DCC48_02510 [Acidobacteriota bacterium]